MSFLSLYSIPVYRVAALQQVLLGLGMKQEKQVSPFQSLVRVGIVVWNARIKNTRETLKLSDFQPYVPAQVVKRVSIDGEII